MVQAQFCLDVPLGNPCFNASPQFIDIISSPPNDVIVGPSGSVSQPYAPLSFMGLGSFLIDPGAILGSSVVGNILLTYNEFDGDPNQGGNQIGFNEAISAAASVTAAAAHYDPRTGNLGTRRYRPGRARRSPVATALLTGTFPVFARIWRSAGDAYASVGPNR